MSYEQAEKLLEQPQNELAEHSQKLATSQNKPAEADLTPLEIKSLRQDLQSSAENARQILQSRQKKFNI